ncbi:MAG: HAMP domain-containing protein, partial [Polyangiaceae bacterium]|nr:HAMP domain-containing protein [Polyangiaceae bacterium]
LFLALPIRLGGETRGVVYVVRSTTPVMQDLYRIREGLAKLLVFALSITIAVTLLLSLSITRPLARLARSARRIAGGERDVPIEGGGHGEIGELADAFATMTKRLDDRLVYARDFAADVAHELKSPLTSIRGAAELLDEGAADDPRARARFLGNIRLDVERLDRIVSRLLELGRIEAATHERVPVDLVALAEAVGSRTETPDVVVRVEATGIPALSLRASDADAALQNVIENAVRFSPAGSAVVVRIEAKEDEVVVHVVDRGPGIGAADLPKIFDRFFTTDIDRNGTGLGLAIAKSAMQTHGGSIEASSRLGEGTIVRLRFPMGSRSAGARSK